MIRKLLEKALLPYAIACVALLLGTVGSILVFLIVNGAGRMGLDLIFGSTPPMDALLLRADVFDGIFPAIAGTLLLILFSVALAVPIGVAAGIFMAQYCTYRPLQNSMNLLLDILAGIPSIIVGLFGFSVAIFLHRLFEGSIAPCLLISALSLCLLVLPYIIRTTQTGIENVPVITKQTAIALGATRLQNIIYVLLPRSFSSIMNGVILAVGRCAEDTAVILLTGVVAMAGVPFSVFMPYEALPFYIYYMSAQYSTPNELANAYGAALTLLIICTVLFLISIVIERRLNRPFLHRI